MSSHITQLLLCFVLSNKIPSEHEQGSQMPGIHLWVVLSVLVSVVSGFELFTSPHDLEHLVQHENRLLHALYNHIAHQHAKLALLIKKNNQLLSVNNPQETTAEEYLADPVNAFLLIRRLAKEWPLVLHLMMEQLDVPPDLLALPTEAEMQSAFRGLARLQEVYRLDTKLLASGTVDATSGSDEDRPNITAMDCYEMGKYWYQQTEFDLAWDWFHEALMKISHGDLTIQRQLVMTHLYLAVTFSGCQTNMQTSPTNLLMQQALTEHPDLMLSRELSVDFSQALAKNCSWVMEKKRASMETEHHMDQQHQNLYSEMCLGLGETPPGLKCYYVHYNNPRLIVAPFKAEEIYINPPVLMFHDVISDQEILDMKTSFFRDMSACETVRENESSRSHYRTCHVGWVEDTDCETSARLSQRMADMSNLIFDTSEINQVANYGLGGEFQLHYDPIENTSLSAERPTGNRIATVMIYLNDVASGGRTIFPNIRVSVTPKKGSALFWYNLDRHSENIPTMLHGGCPVLRGSKWVINKWIHEGGQDFQTTCPSDGVFPQKYFYLNNNNPSVKKEV